MITCHNCAHPIVGTARRGVLHGQWLCSQLQDCAEHGVALRLGVSVWAQRELFFQEAA